VLSCIALCRPRNIGAADSCRLALLEMVFWILLLLGLHRLRDVSSPPRRLRDARPQALLALAPLPVMLAYPRSPVFLALALLTLVGADSRPQTLLAHAVMLANLRSVMSHMLDHPQSLHLRSSRLFWHRLCGMCRMSLAG
jgi:hypothetical protein